MVQNIELVCPECKEKFQADVYTSINVQMDKNIKNKVLNGTFFDFECTYCHKNFNVPYPVLYHDMDRKLLLQFSVDEDVEQTMKVLSAIDISKDYTVRFVDTYRNWIEKILIFDSGLDDRIMELYKLLVLSQYEDASNLNGLYYWNIQNVENPHYVLVLDEKQSDTMHFMPFHMDVYKQVEEVFLQDLNQDYVVDASWAVAHTK